MTVNYNFFFKFSDCWNKFDCGILVIYLVILILRAYVVTSSRPVRNNRVLVIASYLYGVNALGLSFRAFGHIMEQSKRVGTIQIALFSILSDIRIVLGQFLVAILAFSFAITKVYIAEKSFIGNESDAYGK